MQIGIFVYRCQKTLTRLQILGANNYSFVLYFPFFLSLTEIGKQSNGKGYWRKWFSVEMVR